MRLQWCNMMISAHSLLESSFIVCHFRLEDRFLSLRSSPLIYLPYLVWLAWWSDLHRSTLSLCMGRGVFIGVCSSSCSKQSVMTFTFSFLCLWFIIKYFSLQSQCRNSVQRNKSAEFSLVILGYSLSSSFCLVGFFALTLFFFCFLLRLHALPGQKQKSYTLIFH